MYTKCVTCPKLGNTCRGPRFIEMSANELKEWSVARKKYLGLSNQKIADKANMAKGTVDGFFAASHTDFKYETVRPIIRVLLGSDWDDDPCDDLSDGERSELQKRIEQLEHDLIQRDEKIASLQKLNDSLQTLVTNTNARYTADKDFLRGELKRKNKIIAVLSAIVGIETAAIMAVLIVDRLNEDIGFFWLRSWFGDNGTGFNLIRELKG